MDVASEKTSRGAQFVGIGLKEDLGVEHEEWVEVERKEQRESN